MNSLSRRARRLPFRLLSGKRLGVLLGSTALVLALAPAAGAADLDLATGTYDVLGTENYGNVTVSGTTAPVVDVNSGATLNATADLTLGDTAGESGTVTVTSDGVSAATVTADRVYVGLSGTGTLDLTGGTLTTSGTNKIYLGWFEGSEGILTATHGSEITTSQFDVGNSGNGTATISGGSTVTVAGDAEIAINVASTSSVTVTGTGSTMTASRLYVGMYGHGTLNIEDGASVSTSGTNKTYLGYNEGGSGTVTLRGTSSLSTENLYVGWNGAGTLNVHDTSNVIVAQDIQLATYGPSSATVAVKGGSMTSDRLYVGMSGTATLQITDGGTVSTAGTNKTFVGYDAGGSGTLAVSGTGSTFTTGEFDIGWNGTGLVAVGIGGTITTTGYINLGTYSGSDGTLAVVAGGTVNVDGGTGTIQIASDAGSKGALVLGNLAGETALEAGSVNAGRVLFGNGDGSIVFNHTGTNYEFDLDVEGNGLIAFYAGYTLLTGDYSAFTGSAAIYGGTMAVDGDFTFVSGSTLTVGVNPDGSGGTLDVDGQLTIDSGSTLDISAADLADTSYSNLTNVTIATATSIDGTFDTVTDDFAFLDVRASYTDTTVSVELERNDVEFASTTSTPNGRAAANAIQSLGNTNALYKSVLALPDGETNQAFRDLSGEPLVSMQQQLSVGPTQGNTIVAQRLRGAFGGVDSGSMPQLAFHGKDTPSYAEIFAPVIWAKAYGSFGKTDSTSRTASLRSQSGGVFAGADVRVLDDWRAGLFAGYGHTAYDVKSLASSGDLDNYSLGAYGGRQFGPVGLRFGASYTWHDISSDRTVAFTGFSESLSADYDAATATAFAEIGYTLGLETLSPGARLEPFAGAALIHRHIDSFSETGGTAALTSASNDSVMGTTTLGLRGETRLAALEEMSSFLFGSVGWRHAYGDATPDRSMHFDGGDAFTVAGTPIDRDTALVETGLRFDFTNGASLNLSYQGDIGKDSREHSAVGNLSFRF
ncbi:T5SS/PEP-CTERM-associated repeat protein [Breoghania corrubedonensis]|uniref:T5SS/PEP-CTERM-associated repeat protein n=1 Tax=Breoghania corrubedonensis TaxID=665038 RepID=A0A2T5VH19_9HYPH|nr:autotransporter domain-containing protein [Breoghania corrubedonensis]PTW63038.1 T5SS/PEP-CTERM-associated repeat protein [Breoghania corrubedonensis]